MEKKITKVRVSMLVAVDVEGYANEYGLEPKPNIVRADVKQYIEGWINDGPAGFEFMEIIEPG
jgi:hypothetical protein